MALAVISGICSALGSAVKIASMFKTQSSSSIVGTGGGSGFFQYHGHSSIGTMAIPATRCGEFIDRMVNRVTREATPALQGKINDIKENLQEIKDFESYLWGDCDNAVTSVDYNKGSGTLFMYIYTFSGFMHPIRGEGVKVQTMQMTCNMELAKDWMVVSKVKASFFKTSMCQEIQYIPQKGIEAHHIIEAISIAMAPCVLGLVQVPERFMTVLEAVLSDQKANPDRGVVTAPTPEAAAQAYEQFKDFREKQDQYEKNAQEGFAGLADVVGQLGKPGADAAAPK